MKDRISDTVVSTKGSLVAMVVVILIMGVVAFSLPVDASSSRKSRAQSLFRMVVFITLLWLTSHKVETSKVNYKTLVECALKNIDAPSWSVDKLLNIPSLSLETGLACSMFSMAPA